MDDRTSQADAALIVRAVLSLGRRLRARRPAQGVTLPALALLTTLARLGPSPAARLAEAERLQPQSLTRMLARLEVDGLVERRPGEDRRTRIVALTEAGREAVNQDIGPRRRWLAEAMAASLSVEERRTLRDAAHLMLRLAEAEPGA